MRELNAVDTELVNGGAPDPENFPGQSREDIERILWELEQRRIWEEIQQHHGK